ncbi:feather keratin 1-like [Grus japonensis]|uniref:Keratin n=1 Tax=Grus japonensis TaxID=30415 RepID=A0ABC9XNN3_GRUJA
MSCYNQCLPCQPCGPTPLANSCNEPCVRQCQDSTVVIQPSPVVVTLPGPILSSFPQSTAVGSSTSAAVGSILSSEGVPISSGGFGLSGFGLSGFGSRNCGRSIDIAPSHVPDLALGLGEGAEFHMGPFLLMPVKIPLDTIPSLKCIRCILQFDVMHKLAEGALNPTTYVVDEDMK